MACQPRRLCLGLLIVFASLAAEPAASVQDEFDDPATLRQWQRLVGTETADHLERIDISESERGWLTLVPRANAWYANYRGALVYRTVEGDFSATTRVRVRGRTIGNALQAAFSLAGWLIRQPQSPSGENVLFHCVGVTDRPGHWQWQSMSTTNGQSQIDRMDADSGEAVLRIERRGAEFVLSRETESGRWVEQRRYRRPDLPATLQVGLMASTDWPTCQAAGLKQHNAGRLRTGRPDLIAQFDYVHLHRPSVQPPAVASPVPVRPNAATPSADTLAEFSDEFDDPRSLSQWKRVFQVERSGADQLQSIDIDRTRRGWLTLVPYTSSWYQDYRGVLMHKDIPADFVITTHVRATQRGGNGPPRSPFSLAGLMVRSPRNVTPATWQLGGENYVFLSLGAAREPARFAFEVKTTQNSRSDLEITPAAGPEARLQVARIGADLILLRQVGDGPWTVHRRYHRPDMPETLQAGLTVYTDWSNVSPIPPALHNRQVIRGGQPDLVAGFDYVRYRRPQVPVALQGRRLSDPSAASDAALLQFLGDTAAR